MEDRADQTVEIKARCNDHAGIRRLLKSWGATGGEPMTEHDTFYRVARGRLKLRRSRSENLLIGYLRPDRRGPKHCRVNLYAYAEDKALDRVLREALGVLVEVKKRRERYFLGNIRFHLDTVDGLGEFLEIEVLGRRGVDRVADLRAVCEEFMEKLGVSAANLVDKAYADLLLSRTDSETASPASGSAAD